MEDLTFGEQVKIILGRKGMTIKQLAELIEVRTGKKMSRQNLTQRLGRDNFQEQDMRMIARILDCPFHLSIMSEAPAQPRSTAALEMAAIARTDAVEKRQEDEAQRANEAEAEAESVYAAEMAAAEIREAEEPEPQMPEMMASDERDMTIGELYDIHEELSELEKNVEAGESVEEIKKELEKPKKERFGGIFLRRKHRNEMAEKETEPKQNIQQVQAEPEPEETYTAAYEETQEETYAEPEAAYAEPEKPVSRSSEPRSEAADDFEPVISHNDGDEDREIGEVNPYTGREYQSNSVRMHPTRIGYVQVYDRTIHKWTDMTEWAFLGLQERKKALLGKAYEPPIYLD